MSVSTEVRRTLVKSPPELWSELSDPSSLAKHLGELGEIRIVRTDPEKVVDWEATAADGAVASGTVQIEPSGWGTKVTLSAKLTAAESPAPEHATTAIGPETEAELTAETKTESEATAEAEPEAEIAIEPEPEMTVEPEPEPIVEQEPGTVLESEPEPERRLRFFARLFSRRKAQREPQEPALAAEPEPPESIGEPAPEEPAVSAGPPLEPDAGAEPIPEPDLAAEPAAEQQAPNEAAAEPDIAGELAALEEQTTAVLTGVLDRLGAAHHRPFSRA